MIERIKEFIWGKAPVLWFPDDREYTVTHCPKMPSAVGMTMIGKPTVKQSFKIKRNDEFRTIEPTSVTTEGKAFIVETKHLTIIFHEKEG